MQCKNCQTPLQENNKFCASCGAKIINHRLNFKSVTEEFFATFISWDNKFFKTFIHLLTKPQEVTNGYLDGVRKRYMQPFAYMLIALSIYGIYMFFSKEMMMDYMDNMNAVMEKFSSNNSKTKDFNTKMLSVLFKYHNIYTLSSIPLLAFINKIIFKKRNFIEHNITLLYAYATFLLLSVIIGFIGVIFNINYGAIYNIIMPLMIIYHLYFYKKMFDFDKITIILKTLYFWLLMIFFYLVIVITGTIIFFILLKMKIITL